MSTPAPQTPADVLALLADARRLMRPRRGDMCSNECLGQCEDCQLVARVDAALRARPAEGRGGTAEAPARWPQAEIDKLRQWIRETGHHHAVYALASLAAIEKAVRRAAPAEAPPAAEAEGLSDEHPLASAVRFALAGLPPPRPWSYGDSHISDQRLVEIHRRLAAALASAPSLPRAGAGEDALREAAAEFEHIMQAALEAAIGVKQDPSWIRPMPLSSSARYDRARDAYHYAERGLKDVRAAMLAAPRPATGTAE